MLWKVTELAGYAIEATDDTIGSVDDVLFDDADWTVRWIVVDTGTWLSGRRVLLPPAAIEHPDAGMRRLRVTVTKQQVKDSPPFEAHLPVSRQLEEQIHAHYGWEPYWSGAFVPPGAYAIGSIGAAGTLVPPEPGRPDYRRDQGFEREAAGMKPGSSAAEDRHLRSANDTIGYYIHATDNDIGHVEDFLVEEGSWAVRYMIVDTRNWWPGKRVLISPRWIKEINWADSAVTVGLSRQQVKDSPEYDPEGAVDRAYELRLHEHYRFPAYWS